MTRTIRTRRIRTTLPHGKLLDEVAREGFWMRRYSKGSLRWMFGAEGSDAVLGYVRTFEDVAGLVKARIERQAARSVTEVQP